jgi:glycerate 2-kinase
MDAVTGSGEVRPAGDPPGGLLTPAIRNKNSLLEHGAGPARALALRLAGAGLAACDPARAVEQMVSLEGSILTVGGVPHRLDPEGRILLLGSGKATLAIAAALERILGDRLNGGAVVVRDVGGPALNSTQVLEAAHPIPDQRSGAAAELLLLMASELSERDLLIGCFTGGSSALTSLPPEGVTMEEKAGLHRLLLSSGMPIIDVNTIRKQVSGFKGGRLALAARPAAVINLTVSDVAGDPIDAITDPTVPNTTSARDAIGVLNEYGLWEELAPSIRRLLENPPPAPDLSGMLVQTEFLVTGEAACAAMSAEASIAVGMNPVVLGTGIEEDATAFGRIIGQMAAESAEFGRPFPPGSVLLGCGGESTVHLRDGVAFGRGGPNREAALAAATRLADLDVVGVFLDTDGADGGGEVAGAVVDGETMARASAAGVNVREALATHDSGAAFAALGDEIETGPTHTNVNDLFAVVIGGSEVGS